MWWCEFLVVLVFSWPRIFFFFSLSRCLLAFFSLAVDFVPSSSSRSRIEKENISRNRTHTHHHHQIRFGVEAAVRRREEKGRARFSRFARGDIGNDDVDAFYCASCSSSVVRERREVFWIGEEEMCIFFFFFFLSFPIQGTRAAAADGGLVLLWRFDRRTRKRFEV